MRLAQLQPTVLATALSLLLPGAAFAQDGFDAHGFMQAPGDGDLDDMLITWRAERQVAGSIGISGLFEYADSPVVLHTVSGDTRETEVLVDNLFGMNLGLHAAVHERVAVALSAPVWFSSLTPSGAKAGLGFGDMKLYVPVSVVLDEESEPAGFGFSLIPLMHLPAGSETRMLGNGGFGAGLIAAPGYRTGPVHVDMNLGIEVNPSMEYENLRGGANLLTALGASYLVTEELSARGEVRFDPTLKKNTYALTESPGEFLFSARGRYSSGASWTIGGATGLTPGVSAARFRFFAGVGWTFGKAAQIDSDGDGILDSDDGCPTNPETMNGYLDADGCTDELASLIVNVRSPAGKLQPGLVVTSNGEEVGRTDEQGRIVLGADVDNALMPGEELTLTIQPNPKTGMEPQDIVITLEEGENVAAVDLDWMPGAVKVVTRTNGGAITDATVSFMGPVERASEDIGEDGEEIFIFEPGEWTLLVAAESFGTERRQITIKPNQRSLVVIEVVLEPAIVEITEGEVLILEQILFEFDSDQIKRESRDLVEEIAATLLSHLELTSIEVQGHTDSKGNNRYNKDLSQRRVDSVVKALVELGIAADRLQPTGYGEERPIAPNTTDEGRAKNRRVQFIILETAGEDVEEEQPAE